MLKWPSVQYAVELLAWDLFLGLALSFAAPVFSGSGWSAAARRALAVTEGLCLLGTAGPFVGDMSLQRIGILGYGVWLPISCFTLVAVFRPPASLRARGFS